MIDLLILGILLAIAGGISYYLYKAKKRGETCIGCPYARECAKKHAQARKHTGESLCGCSGSAVRKQKTEQ